VAETEYGAVQGSKYRPHKGGRGSNNFQRDEWQSYGPVCQYAGCQTELGLGGNIDWPERPRYKTFDSIEHIHVYYKAPNQVSESSPQEQHATRLENLDPVLP